MNGHSVENRFVGIQVRLVNGNGDRRAGRLEIYYNDQWGTVCKDQFGNNDAKVACYMLGFGYFCNVVVTVGCYKYKVEGVTLLQNLVVSAKSLYSAT